MGRSWQVYKGWTSGSQQNFTLVRYNGDGSLDTSFGGGIVTTDFRGATTAPKASSYGQMAKLWSAARCS